MNLVGDENEGPGGDDENEGVRIVMVVHATLIKEHYFCLKLRKFINSPSKHCPTL